MLLLSAVQTIRMLLGCRNTALFINSRPHLFFRRFTPSRKNIVDESPALAGNLVN
jgi:hypothetical protein